MKLLYSLSFLLGADNWKLDHLPDEIKETLKTLDPSDTTILDLGCGEGRECISIAVEGWNVIGVDFIPLAIRRAKKAARKAQVQEKTAFYTGDVSKLDELDLPTFQFAYDIGCFHLLTPQQAAGYISGLNKVIVPDGLFLLNAFTPRTQGKKTVGYDQESIEAMFSPAFKLERTNDHSYWRFPSRWYWLRKV